MEKLSIFIITKDNAGTIRQCLESVAWADEIVVVDSGSTDDTEAICREFTDRFIFHEWEWWTKQKAFALSQCGNLWTFLIDADEVVTPELRASMEDVLKDDPEFSGYAVLRRNYYRDTPICYGAVYPKPIVRLFRKDRGGLADRFVHDKIDVDGRCGKLEGYLDHYAVPSLGEWIEKNVWYAMLSAREDVARGRKVGMCDFAGLPIEFLRRYTLRRGFMHGISGLIFSALPTLFRFVQYCATWELQRNPDLMDRNPLPGKR